MAYGHVAYVQRTLLVVVMITRILVIMTATIARIAQAFMSASRREILVSRGRSKS